MSIAPTLFLSLIWGSSCFLLLLWDQVQSQRRRRRREIWPRAGTQFPVRQVHNTGCSFTEETLLTGSLNISTVGTCFTFLRLSVPPVNESISSLLCLKCAGVKYKEQLLNSKRQIKETFSTSPIMDSKNRFYTLSKKRI